VLCNTHCTLYLQNDGGRKMAARRNEYKAQANVQQQDHTRPSSQLGPPELPMAHDFRSRMLRRRDDALVHPTIRSGSSRYHFPCLAPTVRRHDRSRNPHKQDGASAATGLRPDARPAMGHFNGQLRQRRRILPLQLLGHKRMRQDRASRHLRTWLPTHR
jgi:hypothetical protein